jgi:hypothetical protein
VSSIKALTQAVEDVADAIEYADWTDPHGLDVAEMLADVRDARKRLYELEGLLETAAAKAMLGDTAENPHVRVERSRYPDRKKWQHDEWKRDVRRKVIQTFNLKGATVISRDGEPLEISLYEVLNRVQDVHGSTDPRVRRLRDLGLDPDDYCERGPGPWKVEVTRLAEEPSVEELRKQLTGTD